MPIHRCIGFRVLAHKDLQKLSELRDALHTSTQNGVTRLTDKKEMYLFPDGKAWDYQENEVKDSDGNVYTEAVFMDITKQYHEKINLTRQTEKLKEIYDNVEYDELSRVLMIKNHEIKKRNSGLQKRK